MKPLLKLLRNVSSVLEDPNIDRADFYKQCKQEYLDQIVAEGPQPIVQMNDMPSALDFAFDGDYFVELY